MRPRSIGELEHGRSGDGYWRQRRKVPHLLRFCIISLNTLARPDAVLDLSPMQVDIKRRLIKLNPDGRRQTKKYRPVVPISETLLPWMEQCDGPRA